MPATPQAPSIGTPVTDAGSGAKHQIVLPPQRYHRVYPPIVALLITGIVPTVTAWTGTSIAPPAGSLVITGQVPTVNRWAGQTISPPAGSLVLTGQTPTLTNWPGDTFSPPAGSLVLTGGIPTVDIFAFRPDPAILVITGSTPLVGEWFGGEPVGPSIGTPITDAGRGANHQIVLPPQRRHTVHPPAGALLITGDIPVVTPFVPPPEISFHAISISSLEWVTSDPGIVFRVIPPSGYSGSPTDPVNSTADVSWIDDAPAVTSAWEIDGSSTAVPFVLELLVEVAFLAQSTSDLQWLLTLSTKPGCVAGDGATPDLSPWILNQAR